MHIFLSKTVWRGGKKVTAIARHMPDGFSWSDMLSGDGETVTSFVSQEIPEDILTEIEKDQDVLDHVKLQDNNDPIEALDMEKISRSAKRHGIPIEALPKDPKVTDVVEAVKNRMMLAQIIFESGFETSDRIEKHVLERMKDAGFDISAVDAGDNPEDRLTKVQKKKKKGT